MNRLKQFRKAAGITQAVMAKRLGMSESGYCLIENGKRRITVQVGYDIADILNVDINDIFLHDYFAISKEKDEAFSKENTISNTVLDERR